MGGRLVGYAVQGGVATITLDSPGNRNALSGQLRDELLTGLREGAEDPEVRVIVLTHTGSVFCSGMDLREAQDPEKSRAGVEEFKEILAQLWRSPTPIVARLTGTARAGGIGIVAAADIAVATDDVAFAFSEVRVGVAPAMISVPTLPRTQRRSIHELFLTGNQFNAERAVHIGLLNAVCATHDIDDVVAGYVDALLQASPQALAAAKKIVNSSGPDFESQLDSMAALSAELFASEDAREGMAAFREKRRPRWAPDNQN